MAQRSYEIERRFPINETTMKDIDKGLKKIKEYQNIIDRYYIFDLNRRKMVRARSVDIVHPQKMRGMKYQLCSKSLFSPTSTIVKDPEMEMDEINVNVDDFEKLTQVFDNIKSEEFTLHGNRRYYSIPKYEGDFPQLIITTDYVEELKHNWWVEIEILVESQGAKIFSQAVKEICNIALKHFGMTKEWVKPPSKFPTYPEILFWENWYNDNWCDEKPQCKGFKI